jgi:putative spermidine/putrescine transport system substrate-binding protein
MALPQGATGIEIIPVPATVAKLLAMHRSGQMEVGLSDTGDDVLLQLDLAGALEPLDLKGFKRTNPDDIEATVKHKAFVGCFNYAMVMGFHTAAYPKGKEPKSWAEFWDIKAFPGPRTLADMASGAPDLEFALLADGVAMDKLYPLDIDRAFKSLSRVRPAITKFWDTGALSAQMLADKEVVLAALWSTRLGVAIDKERRSAQWNQNAVLGQPWHPEGSKMPRPLTPSSISVQPEIRRWLKPYKAIPVNQKSYSATSPELLDRRRTCRGRNQGYVRDIVWWSENARR